MQPRIEYGKVAPGAMTAMRGLEDYVHRSGMESSLLELVKVRASQINGWNRLAVAFRTVPGSYQPAVSPDRSGGESAADPGR